MIAYRQLALDPLNTSDGLENSIEAEIESLLNQLHQAKSLMQKWASSKGSVISTRLNHETETLEGLTQEFRCIRIGLRAKQKRASSYSRNSDREDFKVDQAANPDHQALLRVQTAVTTSTQQLQANLSNQEDTAPSTERKRKSAKIHGIDFEVFRVLVNPRKRLYAHRFGKPANPAKVEDDTSCFPYVCFKRERMDNKHAFNIMAFHCHANILRLKRICIDKSNKNEKGLIAFVEPIKGTLDTLCPPHVCMDRYGFIPSETFQTALSDVIKGMCFLWMNGLYHGNLNWNTTFYNPKYVVKLANFEMQESVSSEQARLIDRNSLVNMLQHVSNEATLMNPSCSCDLIDSLIQMLSLMNVTSPGTCEIAILDNPFFWTPGQRSTFFISISVKLRDEEFVSKLPSDLCLSPWDTSYSQDFIKIVKAMNAYRQTKGWSDYSGKNVYHFVSCIAGAYTHKNILKVSGIDRIVTRTVPLLVEKLRRLI